MTLFVLISFIRVQRNFLSPPPSGGPFMYIIVFPWVVWITIFFYPHRPRRTPLQLATYVYLPLYLSHHFCRDYRSSRTLQKYLLDFFSKQDYSGVACIFTFSLTQLKLTWANQTFPPLACVALHIPQYSSRIYVVVVCQIHYNFCHVLILGQKAGDEREAAWGQQGRLYYCVPGLSRARIVLY